MMTVQTEMREWLDRVAKKRLYQFEHREPHIGEACIIIADGAQYYAIRRNKYHYQSAQKIIPVRDVMQVAVLACKT